MVLTYQEDKFELDINKITTGTDPTHGETTTFHDVVIASELVQPYSDGQAFKSRDELEEYAWTVNDRHVIMGGHPDTSIVSDRSQVHGKTSDSRFVKNLQDPETGRPNRAGVVADVTIFNEKAPPELLEGMKNGVKRDVSIGFFFHKDSTPGEFKGDAYDYVQRNMFHDHLAVAIDQGRCPSPFCGLGADDIKSMVGDPFAGFANFAECRSKISSENPDLSEEAVNRICGALKARNEDTISEEKLVKYASKILNDVLGLYDEIEALKGERDALTKEKTTEWWTRVDWTEEENRVIFDHLSDEMRQLITDAGLCPHCKDQNGPIKCPEGEEWSEEHDRCVPISEEEEEDVKLTLPEDPESHKEPKSRRKDEDFEALLMRGDAALSNVVKEK